MGSDLLKFNSRGSEQDMSIQTTYEVILLIHIDSLEPGGLIIEGPTEIDPGYQKGDSFKITKRVGIKAEVENSPIPSIENREFSFSATVIERKVEYNGEQKIVSILAESPDREIVKGYAEALKNRNE
ncbi:hypothetical protein B6N60_02456 [Richelia sinica FACHB-800]|uniref:Uncharacterized protein n=2 Tax=Richelia TaxID=98443 RepID=A0A975T8B8_9NOST|nr:hypothetical protein B6N60_02456 [Richelia sinica FACHB-800]